MSPALQRQLKPSAATRNSAIVDKALEYAAGGARANFYKNIWGGNACRDAGPDANGSTVAGYGAGQCRTFVNCIISLVSGGQQYPTATYFDSFIRNGGIEVTDLNALTRGDIVQSGDGVHTSIPSREISGSTFLRPARTPTTTTAVP